MAGRRKNSDGGVWLKRAFISALIAGISGLMFTAIKKQLLGSETKVAEAKGTDERQCEVAGYVYDRSNSDQPLAGIYVFVAGESVATQPDGEFVWKGSCQAITRRGFAFRSGRATASSMLAENSVATARVNIHCSWMDKHSGIRGRIAVREIIEGSGTYLLLSAAPRRPSPRS